MGTKLPIPTTEESVKALVDEVVSEQAKSEPVSRDSYFLERLRAFIAGHLSSLSGENLTAEDINLNPVPPKHDGDYALQVPKLMRDMKRYRGEILPKLEGILKDSTEYKFTLIAPAGPFLNFSIENASVVGKILEEVGALGDCYGATDKLMGKRVIVEYSSPNMGKSLHVGHLGTTLLGEGLANIFRAAGATVFRVSHLGDWGTPCGMLEVGTEMFAEDPEIKALRDTPSKYYSAIYAKFNEAQTENPELRDKAKAAFAALERGEEASKEFWTTVRRESSEEFDRIYETLGIHFDIYLGEAFYEPYLAKTIEDLKAKQVAHDDEAAVVSDLDDVGLKTVLLKKSDGATTYFARDVVALFKRKELFDYDLALYIVGAEQTLHFRQLFELAKRMEYLGCAECAHVPIGLITQNGSKISSRAGGALGAEELQVAVYERAKTQVDESLAEEPETEREEIAKLLTTGALFYNQLLTAPGKSTDFHLDTILDMRGKSGAYLQYSAVRGKSILRKVGEPSVSLEDIPQELYDELDPSAVELARQLALLPDLVDQCVSQRSPHPLAHHLHEVGQAVNQFYQRVRIKDLEGPLKDLYLHLLSASVQVITNGLRMLHIQVPERM